MKITTKYRDGGSQQVEVTYLMDFEIEMLPHVAFMDIIAGSDKFFTSSRPEWSDGFMTMRILTVWPGEGSYTAEVIVPVEFIDEIIVYSREPMPVAGA